jgi:hypothetical protein
MKDEALSPRMITALALLTVAIFSASLLLTARGDLSPRTSNAIDLIGPNSYSYSAIGHLALYDFLQDEGMPVTRSQFDAVSHLDPNAVLVLAEPNLDSLEHALHAPGIVPKTILIVLPKYRPVPSETRKDWIGDAALIPEDSVRQVYKAFVGAAEGFMINKGVRIPPPPPGPKDGIQGTIVRTGQFRQSKADGRYGTPSYAGPIQVIRGSFLNAIISTPEGVLLGELLVDDHRVLILSDPEVLENHGLALPGNAAFAKALIERARGPNGTVIFDETIHGFYKPPPDLLKTLFRFPYILLFAQFLLALALLLWAANCRFGAIAPLPPARTAGRIALIADAAALMDLGGHQAHLLQRYLQISVLDAARRLRAPPGLQDQPLIDWLDRAGKAAGQQKLCSAILAENAWIAAGDLPRLYRAAHAIHFWKKEMIDGSDRRSKNH